MLEGGFQHCTRNPHACLSSGRRYDLNGERGSQSLESKSQPSPQSILLQFSSKWHLLLPLVSVTPPLQVGQRARTRHVDFCVLHTLASQLQELTSQGITFGCENNLLGALMLARAVFSARSSQASGTLHWISLQSCGNACRPWGDVGQCFDIVCLSAMQSDIIAALVL